MSDSHEEHEVHDHDGGLAVDLVKLMDRRNALRLLGGVGLVTLIGCGNGDENSALASPGASTSAAATAAGSGSDGSCDEIPSETGGPFPGDGTNGPNALTESGVIRSDIRSSFGSHSGVAQGVPLTVNMTVLQLSNGCKAYKGAAIYIWHCDREGEYSMYGNAQGANYLRGVQAADADGLVTFKSIFPAAYSGRWPHIHFEVYPDLDSASSASGKLATSQLALPKDVCDQAYATTGYEQSVSNLSRTSLESDMVFADGYSQQLATVTGNADNGFTAALTIAV